MGEEKIHSLYLQPKDTSSQFRAPTVRYRYAYAYSYIATCHSYIATCHLGVPVLPYRSLLEARGIPRTWDSPGIHVTRVGPHVTRDSRGIAFPAPTRGWLDCLVFSWVFNLACSSTHSRDEATSWGFIESLCSASSS
jgi:hypothetical protein